MHNNAKKSHRSRAVAYLLVLCGAFVYAVPGFAVGQDMDITISVAGPTQDLEASIEHEIALPESAKRVQGDLLHGDGRHGESDARGEAASSSEADTSELIGQSENVHQEAGSVEHQSQELLNQAQQSAQTLEDHGGDSD